MVSDQKIRIAILAAGHGKRMKSETPKVLQLLVGKPIIKHLLEAVQASGVDPRPIVIVGPKNQTAIRAALGDQCEYVTQVQQLGTGDAVKSLRPGLRSNCDRLIILNGDHPLVRPETIRRLAVVKAEHYKPIVMGTTRLEDFDEWREMFFSFGRIVRDPSGGVQAIMERKDATAKQLKIKEVNPTYFNFEADWLWDNLEKLNNHNSQGEYYLTDLVRIAIDNGAQVASIDISPRESIGVNTLEQLALAERLLGQ